jgi:hypothetical protein
MEGSETAAERPAAIEMHSVASSNIAARGYDPVTGTMRVEFRNGKAYDYPGTTPEEWSDFVASPSAGQHFHRVFRGRAFRAVT